MEFTPVVTLQPGVLNKSYRPVRPCADLEKGKKHQI